MNDLHLMFLIGTVFGILLGSGFVTLLFISQDVRKEWEEFLDENMISYRHQRRR